MLLIKKGKEPNSLVQYKKQKEAYFDGCNKDDIRCSLLKEQGYLCAYCMQRIAEENMTIEHYMPQSGYEERALDYTNMLGVCNGNRNSGSKKHLICDAHRGNAKITINPLSKESIGLIKYELANGRIYSDDENIDKDLNETLNLNCEASLLKVNRKKAIEELKKYLSKKQKTGTWNKTLLRSIKRRYETKDEAGKLEPYSGVILYYLDKRIK